jgi:hypothetical protein
MKATKINITQTKAYKLLEEFLASIPKEHHKKAEELEEELMRLLTAHMVFVWSIKNCNDKMEEFAIERGASVVLKQQIEALSDILYKIESLNNYYYPKNDEQTNQKRVDQKDNRESQDPTIVSP